MAVLNNQQFFILGAVVLVGGGLLAWKAKDTVKGALTGDNALTEDTPYQGAGAVGTLGAATNELSGGVLEDWGHSLGGWLYDTLNPQAIEEEQRLLSGGTR